MNKVDVSMCVKKYPEYELLVLQCIKHDSPIMFGNCTKDGEQFITKTFIQSAKKSIFLALEMDYADYISFDDLKSASERANGNVHIMVMDDNPDSPDQCDKVVQDFNQIGKIARLGYGKVIGTVPRFIVVDGVRYRFNGDAKMESGLINTVCCYDRDRCAVIEDLFQTLWNKLKMKNLVGE